MGEMGCCDAVVVEVDVGSMGGDIGVCAVDILDVVYVEREKRVCCVGTAQICYQEQLCRTIKPSLGESVKEDVNAGEEEFRTSGRRVILHPLSPQG